MGKRAYRADLVLLIDQVKHEDCGGNRKVASSRARKVLEMLETVWRYCGTSLCGLESFRVFFPRQAGRYTKLRRLLWLPILVLMDFAFN